MESENSYSRGSRMPRYSEAKHAKWMYIVANVIRERSPLAWQIITGVHAVDDDLASGVTDDDETVGLFTPVNPNRRRRFTIGTSLGARSTPRKEPTSITSPLDAADGDEVSWDESSLGGRLASVPSPSETLRKSTESLVQPASGEASSGLADEPVEEHPGDNGASAAASAAVDEMSGEMKTKIEVAAEDRKDATADGSITLLGPSF